MDSLAFRRRPTLTCGIGGICYDTAGVGRYIEVAGRLLRSTPRPWRCPNAEAHPDHPYHFGRRLHGQRAA